MKHPYPLWHPVYWLATWFHSGLAPKAPGTFGTLAALPFAWVIHEYLGAWSLFYASVIAFFIGWLVSSLYVKKTGREDPKEVVIDEVAGIWLLLGIVGIYIKIAPVIYVVGFVLFRLFDIWKPYPVSLADKHIKGGFGIMLDDILAALYGVVAFSVIAFIYAYVSG